MSFEHRFQYTFGNREEKSLEASFFYRRQFIQRRKEDTNERTERTHRRIVTHMHTNSKRNEREKEHLCEKKNYAA